MPLFMSCPIENSSKIFLNVIPHFLWLIKPPKKEEKSMKQWFNMVGLKMHNSIRVNICLRLSWHHFFKFWCNQSQTVLPVLINTITWISDILQMVYLHIKHIICVERMQYCYAMYQGSICALILLLHFNKYW